MAIVDGGRASSGSRRIKFLDGGLIMFWRQVGVPGRHRNRFMASKLLHRS